MLLLSEEHAALLVSGWIESSDPAFLNLLHAPSHAASF